MQLLIPFQLFLPLLLSSKSVSAYYEIYMLSQGFYVNVGSLYIESRMINRTFVNVTIYLSDYFKDVYLKKSLLIERENLTLEEVIERSKLSCERYLSAILFKRPLVVGVYVCKGNGTQITVFARGKIIYKEVIKYKALGGLWIATLDLKYLEVK